MKSILKRVSLTAFLLAANMPFLALAASLPPNPNDPLNLSNPPGGAGGSTAGTTTNTPPPPKPAKPATLSALNVSLNDLKGKVAALLTELNTYQSTGSTTAQVNEDLKKNINDAATGLARIYVQDLSLTFVKEPATDAKPAEICKTVPEILALLTGTNATENIAKLTAQVNESMAKGKTQAANVVNFFNSLFVATPTVEDKAVIKYLQESGRGALTNEALDVLHALWPKAGTAVNVDDFLAVKNSHVLVSDLTKFVLDIINKTPGAPNDSKTPGVKAIEDNASSEKHQFIVYCIIDGVLILIGGFLGYSIFTQKPSGDIDVDEEEGVAA